MENKELELINNKLEIVIDHLELINETLGKLLATEDVPNEEATEEDEIINMLKDLTKELGIDANVKIEKLEI